MKIKKILPHFIRFLIPIIFLAFIYLCSHNAGLSEWYMIKIYPSLAAFLSFFSRLIPFSLLDTFIILAVITFLFSVVLMFLRKLKFLSWLRIIVLSVLWMIVWFYIAWGIGYFRFDFYGRFDTESAKEDREFFESLVERYIDSLNKSYIADPHFEEIEIDEEIELMYSNYHELLRIPHPCGWRRTKKTIFESMMTKMGVSGYFGPFFNEVHLNGYNLPITYPFTLAHEKAHQFGISHEAECNLYAAVICNSSSHPLVRYSGYLKTVLYLMGNLQKISPDRYNEIFSKIDRRIIYDYRAIRDHWQKAQNKKLSAAQDIINDTYLKTNKQRSGILSYSEMTGLLVTWDIMHFSKQE